MLHEGGALPSIPLSFLRLFKVVCSFFLFVQVPVDHTKILVPEDPKNGLLRTFLGTSGALLEADHLSLAPRGCENTNLKKKIFGWSLPSWPGVG